VTQCWVVLLEVQTRAEVAHETVEAALGALGDRYPSALHAPDRCAVQFVVEDVDGPDAALVDGVAAWRRAVRAVGFPHGELLRAEVKTPAELVAEFDEAASSSLNSTRASCCPSRSPSARRCARPPGAGTVGGPPR
jgi:hypothetical protein